MGPDDKAVEEALMRALRHDIKNHLSVINLILGQLRYEIPRAGADCIMYLDMLASTVEKIDEILKSPE